jgi:hypothetical protein
MVNGISSNLIENFANFENFDNDKESSNKPDRGQKDNHVSNDRSGSEQQMNNSESNRISGRGQQMNNSESSNISGRGQKDNSGLNNEGAGNNDYVNNYNESSESSIGNRSGTKVTYEDEVESKGEGKGVSERPESSYGDGTGLNGIVYDEVEEEEEDEEEDEERVTEEFGALDKPIYEGFTNSDFNASNLVRGRNLHNLLKALLISLVLCSLTHKDVSKMIVDPLVKLVHNKLSHSTMVCVLVFVVSYLVIAFL